MKTLRTALEGAALLLILCLLFLAGCGSDGSGSPTGIDNRPIPPDEEFYVTARATVLPPYSPGSPTNGIDPPGSETVSLPVDCDGNLIPAGTTWIIEGDETGGGLQLGAPRGGVACDEPFGNATFVTPIVGGTDRSLDMSVFTVLPNISNTNDPGQLPNPGAFISWAFNRFDGAFNQDTFCQDQIGMNFETEARDCAKWDGQSCPGSNCGCGTGQPDCCTFASQPDAAPSRWEDEAYMDEYTLIQNECGDWVFEPGSPIKGGSSFRAQTTFNSGGGFAFARVEVDLCFRIPAIDPPGSWEPTALAPACP